MKTKIQSLHALAALLSVFAIIIYPFNSANAQFRNFRYEVKNDTVYDCTHFKFDIYLSTQSGVDSLRFAQVTLFLDSVLLNAGDGTGATVSYVSGTSDIGNITLTNSGVRKPTAGGSPPGTGFDTLDILINNTAIPFPGFQLTTTPVRFGTFMITRPTTFGPCWGSSTINKLSFYSGPTGGNKTVSTINVWTGFPSNINLPASSGTYNNSSISNTNLVIHNQPPPSSIPTLTEWGLIALAGLLLSAGILYIRKVV